ncbi:MAG: helix-turn-helix transcriptional regulator [Clostridia bacterium]|nr:helix-turn-helix transcriptional regulator [Clostridia bacterium]
MIAERIKELREQRGITQTELAKKIGITRSGVNAWEMGISMPSTQYVVELAQFFGVSTDYLLGVEKTAALYVDGLGEKDILLLYQMIEHLKAKHQE